MRFLAHLPNDSAVTLITLDLRTLVDESVFAAHSKDLQTLLKQRIRERLPQQPADKPRRRQDRNLYTVKAPAASPATPAAVAPAPPTPSEIAEFPDLQRALEASLEPEPAPALYRVSSQNKAESESPWSAVARLGSAASALNQPSLVANPPAAVPAWGRHLSLAKSSQPAAVSEPSSVSLSEFVVRPAKPRKR